LRRCNRPSSPCDQSSTGRSVRLRATAMSQPYKDQSVEPRPQLPPTPFRTAEQTALSRVHSSAIKSGDRSAIEVSCRTTSSRSIHHNCALCQPRLTKGPPSASTATSATPCRPARRHRGTTSSSEG
jgi:hypothetical protein